MSRISGKDTKPELDLRRKLHQFGFRYRLHRRELPGRPDLVLPRYKAVIFVNGCFWHGHECRLFKWPKSNRDFWSDKICRNRERDCRNTANLRAMGWRVLIVWECATRGKGSLTPTRLAEKVAFWLNTSCPAAEIGESEVRAGSDYNELTGAEVSRAGML